MKNKNKFYITTAIDYVNAEPHIGHAYQKIIADVLARWNKIKGKDVFFLTGTDEHGQKISQTAEKEGKNPKQFVDELAAKFEKAWRVLNIHFDRFIRTTDKDHEKKVQEIVKLMEKNGDIYKGEYYGKYCTGCEAYITEKDLANGKCPFHPNREIDEIKEDAYFFKLSKYQKQLLDFYKKNPKYILPEFRKQEIVNRVKEGLRDLNITRNKENLSWGIPFPLDKNFVIYVWYEALLNYIIGVDWPNAKFKKFWPADVEILGIDNGWFHCVIWPAMLMSLGIKPAKTILINGFLTFNEQKISKSLGNAISPIVLVNKYSADSIRYYVCRNFVFGQDGDFSESALIDRHNNELANKLGNLISRVSALAEQNGIEKTENKLLKKLGLKQIEKLIDNYEFDKALNDIFAFIDVCNEYVQSKKPWETRDKKVLYELADSIKAISILLWPFIPLTSEKIAKQFGFKINYKEISNLLKISKIKQREILFKKIDTELNGSEVKAPSELHFDNYKSYLMGGPKITNNDLKKIGIKIVEEKKDGDRLLLIPNDKIENYIQLIELKLNKGFWNEVVGNKIIFIFKSKTGQIKKFTLNDKNTEEIAKLCSKFNKEPYENTSDLLGYLLDNEFYSDYVAKIRNKKKQKINKLEKIEGVVNMSEMVEFGQWEKIDLRVAQIKKIEDIEGADNLYKLTINLGKALGERIICAGIKQHYSREELKGKKIIVFTNLAPRKIKGIESKGMLLAAVNEGHSKVVLISPEKDVEPGLRIS